MGVSQPLNEKVISEFLLTLNKKVTSECFATHKCELNTGRLYACPFVCNEGGVFVTQKEDIRFYVIDPKYIDYLLPYAPHLFANKKTGQHNDRKFIGIVLKVNGFDYFAPLSSAKNKHKYMEEGLDFIKVKNYAVINLNNMFPVPLNYCSPVDFSKEKNIKYRDLLRSEYRFIKMIEEKIWKNARLLYNHKILNGNSTPLAKRCNDFKLLEEKCREYS